MKRILIIGCSGSGKTTFSKEIAQIFKHEVISLDNLYWKRGWKETP